MIFIVYRGELGNRLAQYCFGRMLAERLSTTLLCRRIKGFPAVGPVVRGSKGVFLRSRRVLTAHRVCVDRLVNETQQSHLILNGSFLRQEYFAPHLEQIKHVWLRADRSVVPARMRARAVRA